MAKARISHLLRRFSPTLSLFLTYSLIMRDYLSDEGSSCYGSMGSAGSSSALNMVVLHRQSPALDWQDGAEGPQSAHDGSKFAI